MKFQRRLFPLLLILSLLLSMTACAAEADAPTPSVAAGEIVAAVEAGTGYADVPADAWYAEAVSDLLEKGIMNGVGDGRFAPEETFTRASLATVLYRMAGEPSVSGEDTFTDTQPGQWYSNAVSWAEQQGVILGYGNGLFGTQDAVTQEQVSIMLWRNAGSYKIEGTETYGASDYADAIYASRWAVLDELINEDGPAFAPREPATRSQVADMVYRYLALLERFSNVDGVSGATQETDPQGNGKTARETGKVLVAYFSRTGENYNVGTITEGNTAKLAREIAAQTGADLFEIVPVEAYPADYSSMLTVATAEKNGNTRPEIKDTVTSFDSYDTIFLGYPIWWGDLPMILHTFMEGYDFTGKTVIPFNTHEGSGQSGTQSAIVNKLSGATVLQGLAMRGSTAQALKCDGTDATVRNWLDGLNISYGGTAMSGYDFSKLTNVELINADLSAMTEEELAVLYQQARYCQAMTDADIDTMRELVSEDMVFTHMSGRQQTREEYFADVKDGSLRYFTIGMDSPVVEVNGNVASVTYTSVLNANAYGARGTYRMQGTHWYEKRNGAWIAVNKPSETAQVATADVGAFDLENGTVLLNSGYTMPILGIGTYALSDTQAENSVYWALKAGFRLIDTARIYGNEPGVGRGIQRAIDEGIVTREEIFVTTKMWTSDFGNGAAAIDASLKRLNLDYIDLMILHHSQPSNDVDAYKAMEDAVEDGKLRSIGLSNYYDPDDFDRVVKATSIVPALLQNETHPYHQSGEMKDHIAQYGTVMESWFPLGGRGNTQTLFNDATISAIAKAHGKSSAQVILRWHLQAGNIAIPGSSNEQHIIEDYDIWDFELSEQEMEQMAALEKDRRFASY